MYEWRKKRRSNKYFMLNDSDPVAKMKKQKDKMEKHDVLRGRKQLIGEVTKRIPKSKRPLSSSRQRWAKRIQKGLTVMDMRHNNCDS